MEQFQGSASETLFQKLRVAQRELAESVVIQPLAKPIRYLAATDVSCQRFDPAVHGAIVVFELPAMTLVDSAAATLEEDIPYRSGYLSFREIPVLVRAFAQLRVAPELILCDGQGLAHPRGLGLACHLGVTLGLPTMGVAKSRLVGDFQEPANLTGSFTPMILRGQQVGWVLRSRSGCKPLFLSPGHLMNFNDCLEIFAGVRDHRRIPRPLREAHDLANCQRRADRDGKTFL